MSAASKGGVSRSAQLNQLADQVADLAATLASDKARPHYASVEAEYRRQALRAREHEAADYKKE